MTLEHRAGASRLQGHINDNDNDKDNDNDNGLRPSAARVASMDG
jgi:hypothetical protein